MSSVTPFIAGLTMLFSLRKYEEIHVRYIAYTAAYLLTYLRVYLFTYYCDYLSLFGMHTCYMYSHVYPSTSFFYKIFT